MNLLKKLANKAYESYSTDDLIEPITMVEVQLILHKFKNTRTRKPSHPSINNNNSKAHNDELDTADEQTLQQIMTRDYSLTALFKGLPKNFYTAEHLVEKAQPLDAKLSIIKRHLVNQFPSYMDKCTQSLNEAKQLIQISRECTTPKLAILRNQLARLNKTKKHSQKVTNLRMKAINIRKLLVVMKKFPRISNMSVRELKKLKVSPQIKALECFSGFDRYVQQKIAQDNGISVTLLKNILLPSVDEGDGFGFKQNTYQLVLYKYLGEGGFEVGFPQLIMGIARDSLALAEASSPTCYELCNYYIRYMLNFHLICRWHHEYSNTPQNLSPYCQQLLHQHPKISDEVVALRQRIFDLRKSIWDIMLDRVQENINNTLGMTDQQMFILVAHVNRFLSIGHRFTGIQVTRSSPDASDAESLLRKQLVNKSIGNLDHTFQKSVVSLVESLLMQENNEWSRMPVDNNYRFLPIYNTLANLSKKTSCPGYHQLLRDNLCLVDIQQPLVKQDFRSDEGDAWTLPKLDLQFSQDPLMNLLKGTLFDEQSIHSGEVVICQSVFPLLKFFDQACSKLFYLRLVTDKSLKSLFYFTELYAYFVFSTFIPARLRKIIIAKQFEQPANKFSRSAQKQSQNNSEPNLQDQFERKRFEGKYKYLVTFLNKFRKNYSSSLTPQLLNIKESKQEQKLLRSRVVACESFKFICSYLAHILNSISPLVSGVARNKQKIEKKLELYTKISGELSEVVYTECLSKLVNLETLLSPLYRLKFSNSSQESVGSQSDLGSPNSVEEEEQLSSVSLTIEQFMKDFNKKLRAINKGQIPAAIIESIFRLFCDFMAQGFLESYCKIRKISNSGRTRLKKLLFTRIQDQMQMYFAPQKYPFTARVAQYVDLTGQSDWENISNFVDLSLKQGSYSYKSLCALLGITVLGSKLNKQEYAKKQAQILNKLKNYAAS